MPQEPELCMSIIRHNSKVDFTGVVKIMHAFCFNNKIFGQGESFHPLRMKEITKKAIITKTLGPISGSMEIAHLRGRTLATQAGILR